jgi:hypothetical protein
MNAVEFIQKLEKESQELNKSDVRILNDETIPIGKAFRQGDVYLVRVPLNHIVGEEVDVRQIVDGASLGARHILKGAVKVYKGIKHPDGVNSRMPLGYAFDVDDAILTHPEHAHGELCFRNTARFQTIGQIDARTLRRVSD